MRRGKRHIFEDVEIGYLDCVGFLCNLKKKHVERYLHYSHCNL